MAKLLVVKSQALAEQLHSIFPDFHIIGKGAAIMGRRYDVVVIAYTLISPQDVAFANSMRTHLGPDGTFFIIT